MITFAPFRAYYSTLKKTGDKKKPQKDLLDELGISKDTVSRIWNDKNVSLDIVNRICYTYRLQLHEVIAYTDNDAMDYALYAPDYRSIPGYRNDRVYPAPLPPELRRHYVYIVKAGHAIMCLLDPLRSTWSHADRFQHVMPVPVKYVLENGYTVEDGWIIVHAPYKTTIGLDLDANYEEF